MHLREYHQATNHSLESVQADRRGLDWANKPLPFKIYTTLPPIALPTSFTASDAAGLASIAGALPRQSESQRQHQELTLETLARLCYFSNGVTRVLRGMPFRAAACTGALYHVELYVISAELPDLEAGVYHFSAHDNALRLLRRGDFRECMLAATGGEPSVSQAPVVVALTSTWWRNAWKYRARAYRHAFWDSGTILANFLSVANGHGLPSRVEVGFADAQVNALLGVDPRQEATIALVALGEGGSVARPVPEVRPLNLPTRQLSPEMVEYPEIVEAHAASSLTTRAEVAAWRSRMPPNAAAAADVCGGTRFESAMDVSGDTSFESAMDVSGGESIESVVLRRGSSRRFTHAAIARAALQTMLAAATSLTPADAFVQSDLYLIINAVDGLDSGSYVLNRQSRELQRLRLGDFRPQAAYLDLGQALAGDAAFNAYWLVNLDALDDRGYRAAQLSAAIEAGKLYLAAYSLGLGATGLTFFDHDVTRFFAPDAVGKSVMFLTAVGQPARRQST